MKTIYLDIETARFFGDADLAAMPREAQLIVIEFGLAVTYEEADGYQTWTSATALWEYLSDPDDVVVGYNIQVFDLPVIFQAAMWTPDHLRDAGIPARPTWPRTIDLFEQAKLATGRWPKLDDMAYATLGRRKTADGKQAAQWLRAGEIDKAVAYCRDDVGLVRDLWTHAEQGHPLILPAQPRYKQEHTIRLWLDRNGQWDRYEVQR